MSEAVTLWDKDFTKIGEVPADWIVAESSETITIALPTSDPAAVTIVDHIGRALRDEATFATVDRDGTRWSGLVSTVSVTRDEQGMTALVELIASDYRSRFEEFLDSLPEVRL